MIGKIPWNKGKTPKIIQYNFDMEIINIWNSLDDIPKEFNKSNIVTVCKGRRKSHKGYIWKYKEDIS